MFSKQSHDYLSTRGNVTAIVDNPTRGSMPAACDTRRGNPRLGVVGSRFVSPSANDRPAADRGLEQRRRAWRLAHQIITLCRVVPQREGRDLLKVSNTELARALGAPLPVELEALRAFVFDVVEFLQGYDLYTVCGCGYLFILAGPAAAAEIPFEEDRDLTWFEPPDLEAYFEAVIAEPHAAPEEATRQICDTREPP